MELVKAKIKGTDDVAVLEKLVDGDKVTYRGTGEKVFAADEVEELGLYEGPQPQTEQAENDPLEEMVKKVTEMVDNYVDVLDRQYWRRQRVEIVKVLMNKLDVATFDPIAITELADKYIRVLKNYE